MPSFNNLNDLAKFLQEKANVALKNEVAETVTQEMQEHIQRVVYDSYEPKEYVRQGYEGGLIDPHNIEVEVVADNSISVQDIRFEGDRDVAKIVETGQGYQYNVPSELLAGRPFTEVTRESLKGSEKLKIAMKKGLKRQGIDSQL